MNTEKIKIGRREYDYFASAAVAKKHAQYLLSLQGDSDGVELDAMIEASLDLLHEGLMSAYRSKSFLQRLISPRVPSREQLNYLVDFKDAQRLMMGDQEAGDDNTPK